MVKLGFDLPSVWGLPSPHIHGADTFPAVSPSPAWDGTPQSGFSVVPTDPVRMTAKPALRLLEPPNQRFASSLVVGATSFAVDGNTLIGGIDRVRFHFEGTTLDVLEPTFRTLTREDGSTYGCLGYWATLRKSSLAAGEALLYVEAIPADATMQSRVIGPYSFFPADTKYDWEATLGASGDYTDLRSALQDARAAAANHACITMLDDGDFVFSGSSPFRHTITGITTIKAALGVTPRIKRASGDEGSLRLRHTQMWFEGIEFDLSTINRLQGETGGFFVLKNCRMVRPNGRELFFKTLPGPSLWADGRPWNLECYFFGAYELGNTSNLLRGTDAFQSWGDYADRVLCAVHNVCDDIRKSDIANERDSITISYSGSGTATISGTDSGGANDEIRTFEFFVDGSSVGSFAAWRSWTRHDDGDNLYTVTDLANYINTLPDWSATVLDDELNASHATSPDNTAGFSGNDFPTPIEVGSGINLLSSLGLHQDGFVAPNGNNQNLIYYANRITNAEGQLFFSDSSENDAQDIFVVNNVLEQVDGLGLLSQVGHLNSDAGHLAFVHNTWSQQTVQLNFSPTPDDYSLVANNVAGTLRGDIGLGIGINNHIQIDAISPVAAGLTQTVQSGTRVSLYVDPDNSDFSPAPSGELAANPKPPAVVFDHFGTPREGPGAVGAIV